ncbi:hypothetical protein EIN_020690 [Entamoeba invadens IP1]|uniref:hypothetical protein n=1 Tax=Entamoeba invadens IP1 TaxID=370355 RepID=UPI0002C3ED66|nr:hypothetical protein EIN_020690 [Entamoeba invadens IP1]ELP90590.1 hypothetical protein EIN_020690 [Entamoeba invadens IP1]|eukprot:XP_004257361.1 hypothetical protein EIN_020690 [Entamoeba invadens IP1]
MNTSTIDSAFQSVRLYYLYYPRICVETTSVLSYYSFNPTVRTLSTGLVMASLVGTIPIVYRGNRFCLPLCIMFPFDYPLTPPLFFTDPTAEMEVVPNHPYALTNTVIHHPFLDRWTQNNNVLSVLQVFVKDFSHMPPLRMKVKQQLPTLTQMQYTKQTQYSTNTPTNTFQCQQTPQGVQRLQPLPQEQYQQREAENNTYPYTQRSHQIRQYDSFQGDRINFQQNFTQPFPQKTNFQFPQLSQTNPLPSVSSMYAPEKTERQTHRQPLPSFNSVYSSNVSGFAPFKPKQEQATAGFDLKAFVLGKAKQPETHLPDINRLNEPIQVQFPPLDIESRKD